MPSKTIKNYTIPIEMAEEGDGQRKREVVGRWYLCLLGIQVEHLLDVRETLDVALGGRGYLPVL